ncbi:hypothetical protein OBBRIDRAFT_419776 [Obba rivulosa]|uniref:Uncharacterized protein n=1 Tax=Obba rivulosa TaxID=1052685 RepID=A0A8E2AH24_9APHY|nr:hypothetical protein OBBRIDRAFT_419776 [Obba rivulosa]
MLPFQITLFALAAYLGVFGSNLASVRTLELSLRILGDVISAELLTVRTDIDHFIASVDIRTYLSPLALSSVEDFVTNTLQPALHDTLDASVLQSSNARIAIADFIHPCGCSCECEMVSAEDVVTELGVPVITSEPGEPIQYVLPLLEPEPAQFLGILPSEPFKWPGTQGFLDVADSPRDIGGLLVPPSTPPPISTHFLSYSSSTRKRRALASRAKPIDVYATTPSAHPHCNGQTRRLQL